MDRSTLEQKALEDHKSLVGKIVLIGTMDGYKEDTFQEGMSFPEPILGRVRDTHESNILRWIDESLDPVYDVEILTKRTELEGVDNTFAYGRSYHMDGSTTPGDFVLPSDELLTRCVVENGNAVPALRLFEVTLPGFDGGTDETDDLVLWVAAPEATSVEQVISGTNARLHEELSESLELADLHLPAQNTPLLLRIAKAQSELDARANGPGMR